MTLRISALLGLTLTLAAAGPGLAQPTRNYSEDGRVTYLRQDDRCQAYIGAFMAVTDDEFSPSPEDKALLAGMLQMADRIIYDAHKYGEQVGADAVTDVVAQVTTDVNQRSHRFDHLPAGAARAAALRADLTPDIRDCLDRAERLEKPPQ
jgi:hypothetical protein